MSNDAADGMLPRVTAPDLSTVRASIDRADRAVADLLVRRARMARRVALLKLLTQLPARDPERERQVRANYGKILAAAGWSERSLDHWLETMLSASRDLQGHLMVAIQGAPGSWSEESLGVLLPGVAILSCNTVDEAWGAVRDGRADAAWLAARNSTMGDVEATAQARHEGACWAELDYAVAHALVGPRDLTLQRVTRVAGHPLALDQCRSSLDRLVPQAERVPVVDGAHAAHHLNGDRTTAVLASPRLAERLGLAVLMAAVMDAPDNHTTFQLLVPRDLY